MSAWISPWCCSPAIGATPADAARAAEEAGFHAFYVPEHSHIPTSRDSAHPGTSGELPDDRYLRILDPWVALATAATVTSTIRLGTAVALPMEHDPITLAKTLATLDHLSGGRVTLGVGFGWNVANADGWISTPIETDIEQRVSGLNEAWVAAGRKGDPRIVVLLTSRLETGQLEKWEQLGVDEVMFGLPDKEPEDVRRFIARLGASLNRPAAQDA